MYRRPKSSANGVSAPFKAPRMSLPNQTTTATNIGPKPVTNNNEPLQDMKENVQPKLELSAVKPIVPKRKLIPKSSSGALPKKQQREPVPGHERVFEVVWRKQTMKKNKTWDGDGFIILTSTSLSLRSDDSATHHKELSRLCNVSKFTTDGVFSMGAYEVEVTSEVTDLQQIAKLKPNSRTNHVESIPDRGAVANSMSSVIKKEPTKNFKPINAQFKQVVHSEPKPQKGEPLYDPSAEGAIVLKKLSPHETDVVVDPFLAKKLRPHQAQGVKFLYECVMDLRGFDGHGALLADDMGLGKTLMTISTLWTLLKQSPDGFQKPVCDKVLIACPVTLIGNWKKEFKKWLPLNRLNVLTLSSKSSTAKDKQDVKNFSKTKVYQVLIMGYEKILNMKEELALTDFDLLICDEGHRLKSTSNKTLQALNSLNIEKRILLSGTPIQNDLSEFFNIIDFINPGVLGNYSQFKRNFMNPILRSRELNCVNADIIEKGKEKSQELIDLTKPFILRRTASIISNHLPPRTDVVLFCRPTDLQINLFNEALSSQRFVSLLEKASSNSSSLGLIMMFKKICNSPTLVKNDKVFNEVSDSTITHQVTSGKILVLIELLKEISAIGEKVILVSNYTQTLDILQNILSKLNLTYQRLDGSTQNKDRDPIVNTFNNSSPRSNFAFLLSSKSGGVGLNLIGASRLILFDNDWNPSVDLQAMARIHRDGQKRPVFIYRLITTGCIDEKIFQRQLMKNNLSDKFLDNKKSSKDDVFDVNDLKDLFTLNLETQSNTHDLIDCNCDGEGEEVLENISDIDISDDDEESDAAVATKQNSWVSALEVKNNSTDENTERKKTIRKCLADYRHIDPAYLLDDTGDVTTGDDVTERVVNNSPKLISFILSKVNKPTL